MHSGGASLRELGRRATAGADNQKSAEIGTGTHRHGQSVSGMSAESGLEGRD